MMFFNLSISEEKNGTFQEMRRSRFRQVPGIRFRFRFRKNFFRRLGRQTRSCRQNTRLVFVVEVIGNYLEILLSGKVLNLLLGTF